jgi:AraC-like DNA-binding protein
MRRIPRPLLVLHTDPVLREKLHGVARRNNFDIQYVGDWDELLDQVRSAPASAVVVVDPYSGVPGAKQPSVDLAALLNRFPSLAVTAALGAGPGRLEHVRKLGEWGVVEVVDLEEEATSIAIGDRLLAARGRPLRSLVERALPISSSGAARAILGAAAMVVSEGGQGQDLARALHITPRTLLRWCRRAALPAPRVLLAWMRILLAAELIDDPGRTISDAALSCGYSSDASLRNAVRNFVGLSPSDLRDRGAFATASDAFLAMLAEARSSKKRYRVRGGTSADAG